MDRLRGAHDIGVLIRDVRQERGLTQAELAVSAGVGRQWLVSVESGKHGRAEIDKVLAVMRVLHVRVFAERAPAEPTSVAKSNVLDLATVLQDVRDAQ